jgi:hypothetical protein
VRGHVGHPPYASYPRRALTPRRRRDRRSLRSVGGDSPVPSVASGPRQVVLIHRPAHRPWRAIGRQSGARRRPCPGPSMCASGTGVTPPTPTDLPRAYKPAPSHSSRARASARATAIPPLAPPVRTSLQSKPTPTQAPKPFLVRYKNSPSRMLIKPSPTIAGA